MTEEVIKLYTLTGENVLAGILHHQQLYWMVADKLKPEHFLLDHQQRIYTAIQTVAKQGAAIAWDTVAQEIILNHASARNQFFSGEYDDHLKGLNKSPEHFQGKAAMLTNSSLGFRAVQKAKDFIRAIDYRTLPIESIKMLQMDLEHIANDVFDTEQTLSDISVSFVDDMEKAKDRDGQRGIDLFGIPELDNYIPGEEGDLIIIAGRPGSGKSSLQNSAIVHCINAGIPALFWSLEMPNKRTYGRIVSALTGIGYNDLTSRKFSDDKMDDVIKAIDKINASGIILEQTPGISAMDLKARVSAIQSKQELKAVFIDRLGLMTNLPGTGSMQKVNKIAETTKMLRTMSSELSMPIIAHSQLNRAVESRPDKMPQLSDLRDSGAIEQDATKILFLMRPEYYNIEETEDMHDTRGMAYGIIAKNTNGKTGKIIMRFNAPQMYFSGLEKSLVIDYDSGGVEEVDVWGVVKNTDRNLNPPF